MWTCSQWRWRRYGDPPSKNMVTTLGSSRRGPSFVQARAVRTLLLLRHLPRPPGRRRWRRRFPLRLAAAAKTPVGGRRGGHAIPRATYCCTTATPAAPRRQEVSHPPLSRRDSADGPHPPAGPSHPRAGGQPRPVRHGCLGGGGCRRWRPPGPHPQGEYGQHHGHVYCGQLPGGKRRPPRRAPSVLTANAAPSESTSSPHSPCRFTPPPPRHGTSTSCF